MLDVNTLFNGQEYRLEIYNGKPILNVGIAFYYDNCGTETEFDFPDYVSSSLVIYNERLGRVLKTIPLTRTGNVLFINTQDTNFDENGRYFYEINYIASGGYERNLRYGEMIVK